MSYIQYIIIYIYYIHYIYTHIYIYIYIYIYIVLKLRSPLKEGKMRSPLRFFCHHAVAAHGGAVVAEETADGVRIPFSS